jgi:hypothetical protein
MSGLRQGSSKHRFSPIQVHELNGKKAAVTGPRRATGHGKSLSIQSVRLNR